MIRAMLVDDHELVRMGLRTYLESEDDIEVVAEAADGESALAEAEAANPDVILMDLLMPKLNGVETTERLRQRGVSARIVILTSSLDDDMMVRALRCGAVGYILKTSSAESVADAIRQAALGQSVLDPQVQQKVIGQLQQTSPRPEEELTDRERDVLKGIASGKSNQEIADDLNIGIKTVKTHVSNIFLKLNVLDRTQAAIYAIRNKLD